MHPRWTVMFTKKTIVNRKSSSLIRYKTRLYEASALSRRSFPVQLYWYARLRVCSNQRLSDSCYQSVLFGIVVSRQSVGDSTVPCLVHDNCNVGLTPEMPPFLHQPSHIQNLSQRLPACARRWNIDAVVGSISICEHWWTVAWSVLITMRIKFLIVSDTSPVLKRYCIQMCVGYK